jgi:16S rRNA (cytosine1402-N4)-methyltransferase
VEHVPVLLDEVVAALAVRADGTYVDGTFGRGGHARALLAALGEHGRLVALDRDPAAADAAALLVDRRFLFRRAWFSALADVLDELGIDAVDGVLLDLGVSSPQLDDAARGFSYRFDGPLDMRMDPTRGESAAAFLARADVRELTEVIRDYGEERFAPSIARAIAQARTVEPIATTRQLAGIVAKAVGTRTKGDWRQDPAARTFQALRIAVNRELDEVSAALPVITRRLAPGGRLAVISFHSLEDRRVKRFIAAASTPFGGDPRLARLPIRGRDLPAAPLVAVGGAIKAGDAELARNPRARSAVLRVAERTDAPLPADWPRGIAGLAS